MSLDAAPLAPAGVGPTHAHEPTARSLTDTAPSVTELPRAVDLHRQIRRVVAAVIVASRGATLAMVALSVVGANQAHVFTDVLGAAAIYTALGLWSATFVTLALRRDPIPGWVLGGDVAVTSVCMMALPLTVTDREAFDQLANPVLEPLTVAIAIAVALVTCSVRWLLGTSLAFGVAYGITMAPIVDNAADVASTASVILWQLGAGVVSYLFIRQLRSLGHLVETVTAQVVAERESVATRRAYADERLRQFREHVRRYRALHDGPLRILRAVAGPGPAAHPDPEVRRQCAVSVNVLRGAAPDDPQGTLTDLSLALIEAGNESAALGLRVEYHFANLPEDLPPDVVTALSRAAAEALSNVAAHAGTDRVRLTALSAGPPDRPTVTVAIVDQGAGFDPATVPAGYGIQHSIVGRMSDAGGRASLDSHPAQGTRIDLTWPAPQEQPALLPALQPALEPAPEQRGAAPS